MDYIGYAIEAPSYVAPNELVQYVMSQSRFLPVRITINDRNQYTLLLSHKNSNVVYTQEHADDKQDESAIQQLTALPDTISVGDCVLKGQDVLGLKINELAKLLGVSRATLDLHRKGANVKDMTAYHNLYSFISSVEKMYGESIKHGIRNVLVERKTLVQHLVANSNNLNKVMPLVAEVSDKLHDMRIVKPNMDVSKVNNRLSGIGRMA